MTKHFIPLVIFIASAISSCRPQSPALKVTFGNVETGTALLYDTRDFNTDTIPISDGDFEFNQEIESPGVYYLWIEGYNSYSRSFWLVLSSEPTEIKFDNLKAVQETQNIYEIYPNQPEFIKDPNFNEGYYRFKREWIAFYDSIQKLMPSDYASDTLLEQRKTLYNSFINTAETAVTETSQQLASALILEHLRRDNLLELEKFQQLYEGLSPDVKKNPFVSNIEAEAGFQPGSPAPDFEVFDLNGDVYKLEKLKGTKVLLHFWSSTCAPCINEAPKLLGLQEINKSLAIINVSLDTDKIRWLNGISRAGITDMVNICDLTGLESSIAQDYGIRSIPAYYLIDENGKIITKGDLNKIFGFLL